MTKPRTIITTDMECDDMNSLIHLCLYLNELEIEGIVYTSSQYHFNGDGVHTLGEVTPHYRCQGLLETEGHIGWRHPDPEAGALKSYRPFETGWIENLFRNEYAQAYPYLKQNAEGFPSPEEMLAKVKYGNYEFEGDVRHETEGSRLIADCIMDDRTDPLYLQSWGGANTIVRALMSIHEQYGSAPQWESVRKKVTDKVRILGIFGGEGQDNSFIDEKIPEIYPGIVCLRSQFMYASFMSAKTAQPDTLPLMQADYMYPHFKVGHGPLMAKYCLYGDGTVFEGEAEKYQYGLTTRLEWSFDNMPVFDFNKYDILGEGDSGTYIPLFQCGLRGLEDYRYGTLLGKLYLDEILPEGSGPAFGDFLKQKPKDNPFLKAYHEDFAARADWCVKGYDECNHNPKVAVAKKDICAAPGERVRLEAVVTDERPFSSRWWLYADASSYEGDENAAPDLPGSCAEFVIPQDAKEGDFFNFVHIARNEHENPMTGYGQTIVHVVRKTLL